MIRPVLVEVALFLTPFALYAVYLAASRSNVIDAEAWRAPVLGWLALAAMGLILGSFVVMAQFGGAPPNSSYSPARMENGRLVPGSAR